MEQTGRVTMSVVSRPRLRALRYGAVLACATGILLQAVQRVDPTPFLLYFTVHSALLGAVAITALSLGRAVSNWEPVRDAACAGLLLSGLVYLTVILPHVGLDPGDGLLVWAANGLLHLVAPALMFAEFLGSDRRREPDLRAVAPWLVFPAAYAVVLALLALTGAAEPPYDFFRPAEVGWAAVGLAGAVCTLLFTGLGAAMVAARRTVLVHRG